MEFNSLKLNLIALIHSSWTENHSRNNSNKISDGRRDIFVGYAYFYISVV